MRLDFFSLCYRVSLFLLLLFFSAGLRSQWLNQQCTGSLRGFDLRRYLVVIAGAEEDAAAGRVPLDQPHPSAVAVQLQHRLRHVAPQAALWDLPYSHLREHTHTCN